MPPSRPAAPRPLLLAALLAGTAALAGAPPPATAQPTEFALPLGVTDGVSSTTLTAGADADATDDFDPGLDVLAPPPPPPGAFDARIAWQNGGTPTDYYTDLRAVVAAGRHAFRLTYAPGDAGDPVVLSWSASGFHPGWSYALVDELDDPDVVVDLRATSTLDTGVYDETDDPDCAPPPFGNPDACIRNGAFLLVDVPAGPVVPTIEPVGPPIVIPPGGGPFSYRVSLTNVTGQSQTVTADVVAVLPSGAEYGPIQGPRTLNVPADRTVGPLTLRARVPGSAPAGTYALVLRVLDGSTVVATDQFAFEKVAAAAPQTTASGPGTASAFTHGADSASAVVYPNPAQRRAAVRFAVAEAEYVRLTVFDALGREVAVLLDGPIEAGAHVAVFDGEHLPSGVYVWRLDAGRRVEVGRLTLLK